LSTNKEGLFTGASSETAFWEETHRGTSGNAGQKNSRKKCHWWDKGTSDRSFAENGPRRKKGVKLRDEIVTTKKKKKTNSGKHGGNKSKTGPPLSDRETWRAPKQVAGPKRKHL